MTATKSATKQQKKVVPTAPAPTAADDTKPILAERYKTRMCRSWEETGKCPYEGRCMFAHGEEELRTTDQNIEDGLITEEAIKAFQRQQMIKKKQQELAAKRRAVATANNTEGQQQAKGNGNHPMPSVRRQPSRNPTVTQQRYVPSSAYTSAPPPPPQDHSYDGYNYDSSYYSGYNYGPNGTYDPYSYNYSGYNYGSNYGYNSGAPHPEQYSHEAPEHHQSYDYNAPHPEHYEGSEYPAGEYNYDAEHYNYDAPHPEHQYPAEGHEYPANEQYDYDATSPERLAIEKQHAQGGFESHANFSEEPAAPEVLEP